MLKNILLCGVGGQGVLLAAKLIAHAAKNAGFRVFTNEIHGMAQRGGSVTASVRFGDNVSAPLFPSGTADLLFSMEESEALRNAHCLKKDGAAVIALQSVIPLTVTTGAASWPDDMDARLKRVFPRADLCDCTAEARMLGNPKLANTILLGVLSRHLPEIPEECWRDALALLMKKELFEINCQAFKKGRTP